MRAIIISFLAVSAAVAAYVVLSAWLGLLPFPEIEAARQMTLDDVECDWPTRTITLKPGFYTSDMMEPIRLCGWWQLDGTVFINGGGAELDR